MLLDTSVIVEIFRSPSTSRRFKRIAREMGDEEAFVSQVQLAEVADWAIRNGVSARDRVSSVKEFARVVPLDDEICLEAPTIKNRRRESGRPDFSLLDGIILATARSISQRMLTLDRDFEGEADCTIIS